MMTIGSAQGTGSNMQAGSFNMQMQADSVSKNIRNQIAEAQKELQELSSKEEMTQEEKMKKRQELQQEIALLNQQLHQHQIEQRKEQQAKKASADNESEKRTSNGMENKRGAHGLSQAGMQAMLSADASVKQAEAQGRTVSQMNGKASVLEAEIKMDSGRGSGVKRKEEELADMRQKAQEASSAQMSALADAGRAMEKTSDEEEQKPVKEDKADPADKTALAGDRAPGDEDAKAVAETERESFASGHNPRISIDVRL